MCPPRLRQVRTFTQGAISPIVSVCTAAAILLVSDLLGGMRSVAYTGAREGPRAGGREARISWAAGCAPPRGWALVAAQCIRHVAPPSPPADVLQGVVLFVGSLIFLVIQVGGKFTAGGGG